MSIVLDDKEFREVNVDVKGNNVGSIGEVASTVFGSNNSGSNNNVGSKGNVESLGYIGSIGKLAGSLGDVDNNKMVESNGNIGSIGSVGECKNLISVELVNDTNKFAESNNALSANNLNLNGVSSAPLNVNEKSGSVDVEVKEEPMVYREYKYRFVIMLLYFGLSNAGQLLGSTCSPIITNLQKIYGIDQTVVNLSSLLGMIVYLPATIPGNYILDHYGIRWGIWIGTALTLIGAWFRMLAGYGFIFVLIGQLIGALGAPMLCNCPQKISAYWVGPKSRMIFTALLTLSGIIGSSVGFLLPGYIVGEEDDVEKGKALFMRLLLIEAIIATVLCAPSFFFFKERPKTPPSPAAMAKRANFKNGLKLLFKNKNFLWLLSQQCCVLGAINALLTVQQSIIDPFGYTQAQSSILGTIVIVASTAGTLLISSYITKTKKFKLAISVSSFLGLAGFGALTGALYSENFVLLAITMGALGFVISPSGPISLEFACELTFPVGEAQVGGLRLSLMQLVCPAQSFIIGGIMAMQDQRKGALYSMIMLVAFMGLGFICSLKMKEDLLRTKHEKEQFDKDKALREALAAGNPETPCVMIQEEKEKEGSPAEQTAK